MVSKQQIPSITLAHAIVCDDIRREDNGKFILIGVYPELIMLNVIPAQITLSIWLQYKVQIFNKTTLEFEIRGNALPETMPFSLQMGDEDIYGKTESVPLIIRLPFNIKSAGDFTVYYRRKGESEWLLAQSITVKRNTASTAQTMQ